MQEHELSLPIAGSKSKFVNLLFINSKLRETTFKKTIIFYIVMAIIFITLSITLFIVMSEVHQVSIQYYFPLNSTDQCKTDTNCTKYINIQKQMAAPIYFMYELGNFYQNHRKYIQSKSNYQLAGNTISEDDANICRPYRTNKQMGVTRSWGDTSLNQSAVASPCGAIGYLYYNTAKTFFTDTFEMFDEYGSQVEINQTDISWPGDQGYKYKRESNSINIQWINPQDEHFIVWMRTSGLPNFKKLWGRIQSDLQPGLYIINISNKYNSSGWQGNRFIHLTTNTIFGGKNVLMPCAFMVLGLGCVVASLFLYRKWKGNRNRLE